MQAAEQQLEEVYRVAPVPEEYMKYQLHLNTGMEMEQIDQWFKDRRARKSTVPEIKSGATVTTGMKGGAAWENDSRGREPAVSSVSTGQPGLNIPAAAVNPQHKSPDQAGQSADRLRGGSNAANEAIHSGRPGLMGPPQRPEASAAGRPVQPGSCTDVRARNASKQALDTHLTMHPLDWLGESSEQGDQPRPGSNNDGDGALRQASGALIETMAHPNNASFLLSFMDGGGAAKEGGDRKEQLPGSFQQPAPNGRSLAEMPPAGYPTAAAGGSRSSGSVRSPGSMAPPPAQGVSGQQRSWPDGAAPPLARGSHSGAAAILDQFDAQCTGDKQMREWFSGGGGQSGLPLGSSGSGAGRNWRLQQWDIRGAPTTSQAPYPQSDMLMYPMSMAGRSAQDAAQQYEELEKGQELQRGTASLPALPGHYRQELLGGFPSRSHDGRRSTADLSSWRRPTLYSGSGSQQAIMPDIPVPIAAAAHTPVGLANHMSDPTPLANQALVALVDSIGSQRRSAPLPRSISDVSEGQRFSGSGSGGFPGDTSRSASDGAQHASGDLLLPDDPASTSEVRFVEQDLDCVAGLIGLQTIASVEEHEGSRQLFLFEQLTHLDSLAMDSNAAPNPGKRRRVRHQHFWRNSDKLPPEHRLYVTSADIKLALEQAEPVKPRRQITSAERTNMWTVCLTSQGVLGYLNRRVSPLGVRLFRASQAQVRAGSGNALGQKAPSLPALLLPKPKPAGPPGSGSADPRPAEEPASAKKRRTSLRRSQS
ncbi:hypothetical protein COCOBI_02-1050 [Coccomyxa sp. Obi]|nr:hypothetical protein COCOBI_02-1050 [Coccomyxa sp. Obi]